MLSGNPATDVEMIRTHAHTAESRMALSTVTDLPLLDCALMKAFQKPPSDNRMLLPSQPLTLAVGLVAAVPSAWVRDLITAQPSSDECCDAEQAGRAGEQ